VSDDMNIKFKTIIFTSFFLFVLFGCTSNRDEIAENNLIQELKKHKNDDYLAIDLKTIFGNNWRKICIQGPYSTKDDFEKRSGEKLKSLPLIASNAHALLIFYQNDDFKYVEFDEVNTMDWMSDALNGSSCTEYSHSFLHFKYDKDGYKKFYLEASVKQN
jgi:hypothetical protein